MIATGVTSPRRVALVCSGDTHVRMFAPVAAVLREMGFEVALVTLDAYYDQGADSRAANLGHPAIQLPAPTGVPAASFYRRPTPQIWWDVFRARRLVRDALRDLGPDVVAVGNDRGLVEKLVLRAARELGARTALVQDGQLASAATPEAAWTRRLWRLGRSLVSIGITAVGGRDLAATAYGAWGCDVACAMGRDGAALLAARGGTGARIVVTGQPRYDELAALAADHALTRVDRGGVAWFTTPFETSNLGPCPQRAQEALVTETAAALQRAGVPFTIKIHPREDGSGYDPAVESHAGRRSEATPAQVLGGVELAIIGMSSVTDEAVIAGVPVAVPGRRVHPGSFEALLPPRVAFPRIETGADVVELIAGLRSGAINRGALLAGQRAAIRDRIDLDPVQSAAQRVAVAIIEPLP